MQPAYDLVDAALKYVRKRRKELHDKLAAEHESRDRADLLALPQMKF
jgi:hypothetical protein